VSTKAGELQAAFGSVQVRAAWGLLAVAITAYGVSTVGYSVVSDAASRFPSVLDFGLFAFYPLVFAALVAFVRRRVARFAGVLWLDCGLGALVAAAAGAVVVWPQLDGQADLVVIGQFTYFLGDLGFLGFLLAAVALSGWRTDRSLLFLGGGAAVLALLDGGWAVAVAHGAVVPPVLQSIGWPAALLMISFAALSPVRGVTLASSNWAQAGVAGCSAVVCLPIVLLSSSGTPQNLLASVALGVVVIRLVVSLRENARSSITDTLTGLANRHLLLDRLEQALLRQARHGRALAVMFIDLDEFKEINDTHGHEAGDQVLVAVAERLCAALRREDTVVRGAARSRPRSRDTIGRLGGDEFVVLLEGLWDSADAAVVAERVLAELRRPLMLEGGDVLVEASVGLTVERSGGIDRCATELMRDADTAMYAAKRAGKGRLELFEPEMHAEVITRTELIRDLRSAVEGDQLRLVYQPQVDVVSGRMTGVEALVRWEHPELGLIGPDRFIPCAERAGLIAAIDDWVMREACTQLREWDAAGLPTFGMAVNVSAGRLLTGSLSWDVAALLLDIGIAPERLEIEITETVALEYDGEAVAGIAALRETGVRVAIDDFGMGHSALSRLHSFPVDRLKIDRSFVTPLTFGDARGSIADAMVAIGQSLGLDVVAEGVETRENLLALRALGCRSAQGYLFSKPVTADEITRYARAGSPLAPAEDHPALAAVDIESSSAGHERLTRTLLAELQRITGLETTYITRIDWEQALQHITHARNTATIDIPEGLTVDWSDTVCRRALEQGITYTDDVAATFPDSEAAKDLGLQTYLSVPLIDNHGDIQGTLCGASSKRVQLGPEAINVMERFAQLIAQGVAATSNAD